MALTAFTAPSATACSRPWQCTSLKAGRAATLEPSLQPIFSAPSSSSLVVAAAATVALALHHRLQSRRRRCSRSVSRVTCQAVEDYDSQDPEESQGIPQSSSKEAQSSGGAGGSRASNAAGATNQLSSRDPRATQIDKLLPSSEEIVNTDVPNHYLQIYRSRVKKNVRGGKHHVLGRERDSRRKVEWRLKQGPPLAHNNWTAPSRMRVKGGVACGRRLEQPAGVITRPTMAEVKQAIFNQVTSMHLFADRSVRVLDLFSGTGALGVEALSRGATECIFVDTRKECIDCSIANAWLAGFMEHEDAARGPLNERAKAETAPLMMVGGPRAQVQIELHRAQVARSPVGAITADAIELLNDPEKFGLMNRSFNLILVSPPFNEISYRQLCTALAKTELLERDGLVAIEYPRELGVLPPVLCAPFEDPDDADDVAAGVPTLYGVRNRRYAQQMLAIYSKLPTGARGSVGEPRPWEFTETMMNDKLIRRSRDLWQTKSLFFNQDGHVPEFSVPEKEKALPEESDDEK
eukprot:TRINITY_DN111720_c0_g1_i1.p1 TRINITY_DN111720_c0_g1~~TRINITY_DN111720_c0_g1_i1.p1  ORF type:complete len:521 (-),score=83.35 TRINITY_DN111720_c0_g1_i1:112-1674(-)